MFEIGKLVEERDSCQRGESKAPAKSDGRGRRADWKVGDEWSMDLLSDLPETKSKFTQLLVIVEAVSGFPVVYPMQKRTSTEVAKWLAYHFTIFGLPRRLRVDQGGEFAGEVQ